MSLEVRRQSIDNILTTLFTSLQKIKKNELQPYYNIFRDSVIRRFMYSHDALLRWLQTYMAEIYNVKIEASRPNSIYRLAYEQKLIDEGEHKLFRKMTEDRKLTSHTYHEETAEDIYQRIPGYYEAMCKVLERVSSYRP